MGTFIKSHSKSCRVVFPAVICLLAFPQIAGAQTRYFWNNTNSNWSSGSSFDPIGIPTFRDFVNFAPTPNISTYNDPSLTANAAAARLVFGNNSRGGGYTFNGNGFALQMGNGQINTLPLLNIQGAGTTTFRNLGLNFNFNTTLAAGSIAASYPLTVGYGAGLSLVNSNITTFFNIPSFVLRGGAVTLDSTSSINGGRSSLNFRGGGNLVLNGPATGTKTFNFGQLSPSSSEGIVTLKQAGAETLSANFTYNLGATSGGAGLFRQLGTSGTLTFTSGGNAVVGTAGGPQVSFTGSGTNAAVPTFNGVIVDGTASSQASPYAIITNTAANGIEGRFAGATLTGGTTYQLTPATTVTRTDAAGLDAATLAENTAFAPAGNVTTQANIESFTFAINPAASGSTLNLNGFQMQSAGIILSGNNSFTIQGGVLGGGTAASESRRNIFVVDPNGTLTLGTSTSNVTFAGPNFGYTKSGAGFLILGGASDQYNTGQRFYLNAGVLRATINGPVNFGLNNVLELRGGVFEANGGGTFTRPLGALTGSVNWATSRGLAPFGTGDDQGSGGFSAVNGNLTVNIGGSGAPLIWGGTATVTEGSFVRDGSALLFGSTRSDSTVTWVNPLALDTGTPGDYAARIIQVTQGTGGIADRTVLTGAISSSTTTDLIKTGNGTLEIAANNTDLLGNVLVNGGVLEVTGDTSAGGYTFVNSGGTLAGDGIVADIVLNDGGTLAPGTATDPLATLSSASLTMNGGGVVGFGLGGFPGTGDLISVDSFLQGTAGAYTFNFTGGLSNQFYRIVDYNTTTFNTSNPSVFTATGTPGTFFFDNTNGFLVYRTGSISAVPEPKTAGLFLLGLAFCGGFRVVTFRQKKQRGSH